MTIDLDQHRRLAIAPMMELTDRHYRYLARLMTRHTLLYTEMLTSAAVVHGDRDYLLGKSDVEGPVVLQLGGSEPKQMAEAAQIGEQWGYDEINMNVGCPSDRVKAGRFGACLMAEAGLVADNVEAMQKAVGIPVSVKCRLGIDRDDSYEALSSFVKVVAAAGCQYFIVHARKAWLDGLSPKENRSIPPLRYDYVYRLKREFSHLHITINGGIETLEAASEHLTQVDGVMMGRAAYYQPALLIQADQQLFPELPDGRVFACAGDAPDQNEALYDIARGYANYMQQWMDKGVRLSAMSRHVVSLFQNVPGARLWRRHISEQANQAPDALCLIEGAITHLQQANARIEHTASQSRSTMPEHTMPAASPDTASNNSANVNTHFPDRHSA